MMPIPLTPPDDEVGICIPDYDIIYKGLLIFFKVVAHMPFFIIRLCHLMTMSTHYSKLCLNMTLLNQYLHIHFQFNLLNQIFLQF